MDQATDHPAFGPAFWKELQDDLMGELAEIRESTDNLIGRAGLSIDVCRVYISRLLAGIKDYAFRDGIEVISFFKEIKPFFHGRFLFFNQVYDLELGRPSGDFSEQEDYLKEWRLKCAKLHDRHGFLRRYLRSGLNFLDDGLFPLRQKGSWSYPRVLSDPSSLAFHRPLT